MSPQDQRVLVHSLPKAGVDCPRGRPGWLMLRILSPTSTT